MIRIQIDGIEKMVKALDAVYLFGPPLRRAFTKSVRHLENMAKEKTPVDTGRLRSSVTHLVDSTPVPLWGETGSKVKYACVVGADQQVYEPEKRTSGRIGKYPYDTVLSKDGKSHRIELRHKFRVDHIDAMAIRIRKIRQPLVVTSEHLILTIVDGVLVWNQASNIKVGDKVFCKRSHNAITDGSNSTRFVCPCGAEFTALNYELRFREPKYCSPECRHRFGPHDQNTGRNWQLSDIQRDKHRGENNPQWKGGIGLLPYDWRFNDELKAAVKERDGNHCTICMAETSLTVHHRDGNKMNSDFDNLVTLCRHCHGLVTVGHLDCELPSVNLDIFRPISVKSVDKLVFVRDGKKSIPRLYDFTIEKENSFVVSGILVHNSYVEFGSKPHWPPQSAMQPWAVRHGFPAGKKGAFLVARAIARRGTKPHLMFTKAFRESVSTIQGYFNAAQAEIVERWNRGA